MLSYDNSTAMYKFLKPYTLAGFEHGIFCFAGGRMTTTYMYHAARAKLGLALIVSEVQHGNFLLKKSASEAKKNLSLRGHQ
jgi:hypothetical protein